MATWIDKLREWNYSPEPVIQWVWDTINYQATRHGPIAYVITVLVAISLLLAFPPTRGLTKSIVSSLFKMSITYIQLVGSLISVQLIGWLARLSLTIFHKARIWIFESIKRARE